LYFYPDAGAQDPNSAYTQSALTKIIANMSTLVAMWARIFDVGFNHAL
jgi:citrate synthase